ncbi:MAG TPA: hypothetical protein VNC84_01530 [Gammaproteobacteria bacterium]|jgi:hypothetical protein|nr:hypothetical protein [Gammaproteobacteria bacterium]
MLRKPRAATAFSKISQDSKEKSGCALPELDDLHLRGKLLQAFPLIPFKKIYDTTVEFQQSEETLSRGIPKPTDSRLECEKVQFIIPYCLPGKMNNEEMRNHAKILCQHFRKLGFRFKIVLFPWLSDFNLSESSGGTGEQHDERIQRQLDKQVAEWKQVNNELYEEGILSNDNVLDARSYKQGEEWAQLDLKLQRFLDSNTNAARQLKAEIEAGKQAFLSRQMAHDERIFLGEGEEEVEKEAACKEYMARQWPQQKQEAYLKNSTDHLINEIKTVLMWHNRADSITPTYTAILHEGGSMKPLDYLVKNEEVISELGFKYKSAVFIEPRFLTPEKSKQRRDQRADKERDKERKTKKWKEKMQPGEKGKAATDSSYSPPCSGDECSPAGITDESFSAAPAAKEVKPCSECDNRGEMHNGKDDALVHMLKAMQKANFDCIQIGVIAASFWNALMMIDMKMPLDSCAAPAAVLDDVLGQVVSALYSEAKSVEPKSVKQSIVAAPAIPSLNTVNGRSALLFSHQNGSVKGKRPDALPAEAFAAKSITRSVSFSDMQSASLSFSDMRSGSLLAGGPAAPLRVGTSG